MKSPKEANKLKRELKEKWQEEDEAEKKRRELERQANEWREKERRERVSKAAIMVLGGAFGLAAALAEADAWNLLGVRPSSLCVANPVGRNHPYGTE